MKQQFGQMDTIFPQQKIIGFKFKDIKELRDILKCQAKERNLSGVENWFHIAGQEDQHTIMKCKVSACKAYIKLFFLGDDGFLIESVHSSHDHRKNQIINEIKNHHILSPYISSFIPSKPFKQIKEDMHIVKTNCCCKNNPGETAIAYSVSNSQGQVIFQRSEVFQDFTINKGQFIVIMYALLDCHENGITKVQIRNRNKLIVDFMNGTSKISAFGLKDIAQASKLLTSRLPGEVFYKIMGKNQSSPKLQNMCRKLLNLQEV